MQLLVKQFLVVIHMSHQTHGRSRSNNSCLFRLALFSLLRPKENLVTHKRRMRQVAKQKTCTGAPIHVELPSDTSCETHYVK